MHRVRTASSTTRWILRGWECSKACPPAPCFSRRGWPRASRRAPLQLPPWSDTVSTWMPRYRIPTSEVRSAFTPTGRPCQGANRFRSPLVLTPHHELARRGHLRVCDLQRRRRSCWVHRHHREHGDAGHPRGSEPRRRSLGGAWPDSAEQRLFGVLRTARFREPLCSRVPPTQWVPLLLPHHAQSPDLCHAFTRVGIVRSGPGRMGQGHRWWKWRRGILVPIGGVILLGLVAYMVSTWAQDRRQGRRRKRLFDPECAGSDADVGPAGSGSSIPEGSAIEP